MKLKQLPDVKVVALTLLAEAEGEPYPGKLMVAEVIKNRANKNCRSVREVCLSPMQFSSWNTGTQKRRLVARLKHLKNSQAWKDCVTLAEQICKQDYKTTTPATHYYNPAKCSPKWAKKMDVVAEVGNHVFFAERK
jgi:spore germination cell wall hydrolase CwlJ-like protein